MVIFSFVLELGLPIS